MLEPLRLFLELGQLLLRFAALIAKRPQRPLLIRARGGYGALTLLDDASRCGDFPLAIGELHRPRAQLLALSLEARDGTSIARHEKTEHRHRLHRIAAIVDRQQQAHVTESAQSIERRQALAQEVLLARDAWSNRRDLRFRLAPLLFELRLHIDRELQFVRADAELEVRFFEIVLGAARLRAKVVEPRAKSRDVGANARQVGVARGLRMRRGDADDEHQRGGDRATRPAKSRAMHAWPPAAAPLFSTIPRRASRGFPPSLPR